MEKRKKERQMTEPSPEFIEDSLRYRGRALRGVYAHWCPDWDFLPMDESCVEWPCGCDFKEWKDKQMEGETQ